MGNYRLRLSKLIPNAWFYKLRDMGKSSRKQRQHTTASPSSMDKQHAVPSSSPKKACSPRPHHPGGRHSSYYTRPSLVAEITACSSPAAHSSPLSLVSPRKSAKLRVRRCSPRPVNSAVSSGCSYRSKVWSGKSDFSTATTSGESSVTGGTYSPELRLDQNLLSNKSSHSPCSCTSKTPSSKSPELQLRPIITKPRKLSGGRKSTSSSPGLRIRLSSPRVSVNTRRNWSTRRSSTAVVKSSVNPKRDFKDSMVEMIVENNIRSSNDLEELLACYLCLNANEYHDIIINVFKQIWLDLNSLNLPRLK